MIVSRQALVNPGRRSRKVKRDESMRQLVAKGLQNLRISADMAHHQERMRIVRRAAPRSKKTVGESRRDFSVVFVVLKDHDLCQPLWASLRMEGDVLEERENALVLRGQLGRDIGSGVGLNHEVLGAHFVPPAPGL